MCNGCGHKRTRGLDKMVEILLDPAIRLWVIIPIVLISLMFGLVRHYITILIKSEKPADLTQLKDGQALIRSRLLRENAGYIPEQSFLIRRHFFNNTENGYFKQERPSAPSGLTAMGDPSMVLDMVKSTFTNVLPMIVIGGWINWTFSGFLATKVPFPLTYRFKAMLQRGVELKTLSASWVSSMSWYFLNVFGLRSIYSLILGSDNAADQGRQMAMQMNMQQSAMGGGKQQPSQMFKAEWEALQVVVHKDSLYRIEDEVRSGGLPLTDVKRKKTL